jgi:hypothetical protein
MGKKRWRELGGSSAQLALTLASGCFLPNSLEALPFSSTFASNSTQGLEDEYPREKTTCQAIPRAKIEPNSHESASSFDRLGIPNFF